MRHRRLGAAMISIFLLSLLHYAFAGSGFIEVPMPDEVTGQTWQVGQKNYKLSDEALEERTKVLADVPQASKKIRCSLCHAVSANLSTVMVRFIFDNEELVGDYLRGFCRYPPDGFPDALVKAQHWQLRTLPEGDYDLKSPTEAEFKAGQEFIAKGGWEEKGLLNIDTKEYWPVIRTLNSVREACQYVVDEHQSELAEFLYTSIYRKKGGFKKENASLSETDISAKLCFKITNACRQQKSKEAIAKSKARAKAKAIAEGKADVAAAEKNKLDKEKAKEEAEKRKKENEAKMLERLAATPGLGESGGMVELGSGQWNYKEGDGGKKEL